MTAKIDEIIDETKLSYCVECGKCVSVCPMQEIYKEYGYAISPRGINKKTLLGFDPLEIMKNQEIWFCLGCTVCTEICPAGVRYATFIESLRRLALKEGMTEHGLFCPKCGQYFETHPLHDNIREIVEEKGLSSEYLILCPKCRRYDYSEKARR
jgi:heterodisulfide reductase subunit C